MIRATNTPSANYIAAQHNRIMLRHNNFHQQGLVLGAVPLGFSLS